MKFRNLLITIVLVLLTLLASWIFFAREEQESIGEALSNILPFGSGENTPGSNNNGLSSITEGKAGVLFDEFGQPINNLFRLAVEPVAGAVVFNKSSTTAAVRYVDRATGHIFEVILPASKIAGALEKKRVTNRTLPKIYEAYFRADGDAVLMRSLQNDSDTVENISLILTPPRATSTDGLYSIAAANLRGDITSVTVGSGNVLYYSLKNPDSIVSSTFNNTALRTILSSAFSDWRLISAGGTLLIHPKASNRALGYAYVLNTLNGGLTKLVGPLNALAAVPDASGTMVLYSYREGGEARSEVKNLQSGETVGILPVTLAEKCVWGIKNRGVVYCATPTNEMGAGEPDDWYRGATHFSDRLWRFDTNAEIAQILSEPKASLGLDIDVIEPRLSPNEDYLIFINKTDLSLWALKLEQL